MFGPSTSLRKEATEWRQYLCGVRQLNCRTIYTRIHNMFNATLLGSQPVTTFPRGSPSPAVGCERGPGVRAEHKGVEDFLSPS